MPGIDLPEQSQYGNEADSIQVEFHEVFHLMREVWQSRKGFIFAAIEAAIGLGNLWRFPFQAYKNGGGAFLLPYFVALITCAILLMIMEYAYGRQIRGGAVRLLPISSKSLKFSVGSK